MGNTFFILILLAAVIWLAVRSSRAAEEIDRLRDRLLVLEQRLRQLQEWVDALRKPSTPAEPPPTAPEPTTLAHLLKQREEAKAPTPPVQPPTTATGTPVVVLVPAAVPGPRPAYPPVVPPRIEPLPPSPSAVPRSPIPPISPPLPPKPALVIDWEQFMGVKLIAWIGGLALFLGVVFAVKYSFEHELISKEVRVALGYLTGIGLLVGGLVMSRKAYAVTAQTLCATGVLILYAVTFAARSFYGLIPLGAAFGLMVLVTAAAFLLAVRLRAQVVAILGMVGGFLTPVLLSTGVDNPGGLFGYIALLDVGLIAVALYRRWDYLSLLGAVGTVAMQLGWAAKFFEPAKLTVAVIVLLGFAALFLGAFLLAAKWNRSSVWLNTSGMVLPFVALAFTFIFLTYRQLGENPAGLFVVALGADLALLTLVWRNPNLRLVQLGAGGTVFLLLAAWIGTYVSTELLNWALTASLVFAALHSVFPILLQRLRPGASPAWWAQLFPVLALLLMVLPMCRIGDEPDLSLLFWFVLLVVDGLAMVLALLFASVISIVAALLLTVLTIAVWVGRLPVEATGMSELVVVIGGFAVFFFVASLLAMRRMQPGDERKEAGDRLDFGLPADLFGSKQDLAGQVPAFSAILPFLLLIMVVARLPLVNPSPVFGLALLLAVLALGVARVFRLDWLPAIGLVAVAGLENVWHALRFEPESATVPLAWYVVFYGVFTLYPFVSRGAVEGRIVPWAASALAGPLHFYHVHRLIQSAYPNSYMGLVPAAFAIPSLLALAILVRTVRAESPKRMSQLAWFGGVVLFFVTLIFPIQFDKQWITIGWALEGAALLWLFHRVPHEGLRWTGLGLLAVAFARLALNPEVLKYHERAATPILNWYLYTYGLVTMSLFVGARLLAPPRNRLGEVNVQAALWGLGTVLAFLLLNIEIADYFTPAGATVLAFKFSGDFARDMTYSIAWALFALGLVVVGIAKRLALVRYAGLGLLGVTLVKLFFHDLRELGDLYKVGAFIAVAVIAIFASFLYQRFLSPTLKRDETKPPESPAS
jgi:uncharacterized membrane protein